MDKAQMEASLRRAVAGEKFEHLKAVACRLEGDELVVLAFTAEPGLSDAEEDSLGAVISEVIADCPARRVRLERRPTAPSTDLDPGWALSNP